MQKNSFHIITTPRTSRARLGVLRTPHGIVHTPAYVIVATHAQVKTLTPADIRKTKTQLVIANTYHLWDKSIGKKNVVHKTLGLKIPAMTDSGGFQVFSLGAAKDHGVGKVLKQPHRSDIPSNSTIRITEKGVHFTVDKKKRFLSPEISMDIQQRLGADIAFAFDECTSPLHPFAYQKQSMARTHRWAARSLQAHKASTQMLYGIVQGGQFKSLRTQSAKAIGAMAFDGFGIGGSFGKDEMRNTLSWVIPHLPDEKPRHLLGIGAVSDIFDAVEAGVDTMDCVIPTREARHGKLYTDTGTLDIRKAIFAADQRKLLGSSSNFATLHKYFRARDQRAGRLATLHNVTFFNALMKNIRTALADGSYRTFKKTFLKKFRTS